MPDKAPRSTGGAYRPQIPAALAAIALLVVLGLGWVASRHKAAQDAILAEQRHHLKLKTTLAQIERSLLVARNAEATLLLTGGAAEVAEFEGWMDRVEVGWPALRAGSRSAELAAELDIAQQATERYRSAVAVSIRILERLGRAGEAGILDQLMEAERRLEGLFEQLGQSGLRLELAELRRRELEFSNTLNVSAAEGLLADTDGLVGRVERLPASEVRGDLLSTLGLYRTHVSDAMSGVLELELAVSQSSVRFERIIPEIRRLERQLDEIVAASETRLDGRRRTLLTQSALLLAGVLILTLLLLFVEARRARAWMALESRLLEAQKAESLGVLTGGLAHDFNNLLVGVLGNASFALQKMPPDAAARTHVELAKSAASRAAELVKQMLAYAGSVQFTFELCGLNRVVAEMAQLLESSIGSNSRLQLELEPELPAVEIDVTQIRQVVLNLITNASDAIGEDKGVIRVTTGSETVTTSETAFGVTLSAGRYVYVDVSDNGCGMEEETRQRLFDPFFSTKSKGRGLGLAAVLGIVRSHRGMMRVESGQGGGSTFRLLLPVAEPQAVALEPVTPQTVAPQTEAPQTVAPQTVALETVVSETVASASPSSGSGLTILVVDDDSIPRLVAEAALVNADFDVVLADGGHEALEIFARRASEIDLVLLDLTMPGLDGRATYRQLRRMRPDVRVILCSGHPEERLGEHFPGLAGYLGKPYLPEDLVQKIIDVVGADVRRAKLQQLAEAMS